jgi:hypothetical protein
MWVESCDDDGDESWFGCEGAKEDAMNCLGLVAAVVVEAVVALLVR